MTLFLRLLDDPDKSGALANAVERLRAGQTDDRIFSVDPRSFEQVPGSPFAYWVSDTVRAVFQRFPALGELAVVTSGTGTLDDFRFLRAWWEVGEGADRMRGSTGETDELSAAYCHPPSDAGWFPFAKGGAYSPIYYDQHLLVNWANDGAEMKGWIVVRYGGGHWARNIRSTEHYLRPGLTWPRRTNGLSFRLMPAGCIFADKGPAAFVAGDDPNELLALCGILNSKAFDLLVSIQLARTELAQSYEVGLIQQTPIPALTRDDRSALTAKARRMWSLKHALDTAHETSHAFALPALLQRPATLRTATLVELAANWEQHVAETEAELSTIQAGIDEIAFAAYSIAPEDRRRIEANPVTRDTGSAEDSALETDQAEADGEEESAGENPADLASALLSWAVGVAFGRFDVRLATGERPLPSAPEPFDPLPTRSPGMLDSADALPARYPVTIPANGILAEDGADPNRLSERVRSVFASVFAASADETEHQVLQWLGVRNLADYFVRPAAFFADHLKRYSKSRRQAPIYWPLSTASGSYALWIYYHRLTDQTLFTAVNDFVDPKLDDVSKLLLGLRQKPERTKGEERDLEGLADLHAELQDFRNELLRLAQLPWKPNLNDGVQITAAPLWKLFRLPKWQKTLKETWQKLEKGDYDWAHLAYTLWPGRVREKCKTDKSLAIAHDLEGLYEAPPQPEKKRRRRGPAVEEERL